ncbi:hypothetical protein [Aquibium microcysteis]|uniref:hypothetical protein n=1 Tax=Aquibium microcysteis TaxID=675281 RepID=UPI00165D13A3|nr:hypothetical protein [Aquibium microcysteis]
MKTWKSRHALVGGILFALWSFPAGADPFCGPGLKLGAENDCPGCSWLCILDPSPQPMSSVRPAPGGAAGLLQQALSQLEPSDGLSNAGADPSGNGIRSREFNRSALAAVRDGRFMHAALRFRLAAGFARDAGNAREEYLNRRNALLLQLAGKLKTGIEAEDAGRATQAQVAYREARIIATQVAAMPLHPAPATTAAAAPPAATPNRAALDPSTAPAAPASTVSGLGNAPAAAPRAARTPAYQAAPAPFVARTQPAPSPAVIGQVVAPLLQAARQPQRAPAVVQAPAPVARQAPVAAAPPNSTISPRTPSPVPVARAPVQPVPVAPTPAPVLAAPQPAPQPVPAAQPVVVQAPPPARPVLVQPVIMQMPAAPAPGGGIDPQPVAAVPDPDIDYSGMDPDALVNAYGTQDPDYSGRNPYNPDPNAGYDPGGTADPDPAPQFGGTDPGGSPDPSSQYSATAPVAAVRDPDIVCAGGPCTGGAGGGYQGGPAAVDPGTGSLGGPGAAIVVPGADPDGGDDLGGVSIHVDPTSRPWAAGGDLRSKVLKLTR